MPKPVVPIEEWAVVRSVISPTYDKLEQGNHLTGYVFAHAKFRRKSLVYTSSILSVHFSEGIVETLNTMYRLGEPSEEYKAWLSKWRVAAA